jgi:WD40 repeat protein
MAGLFRFGGLVALTLAIACATATAQGTDRRPVLRIEAGTHTAPTGDGATDAAGRILVTASNDKTARVWSLPDLRPLRVLRPPIGRHREGFLYAVAVSPDGSAAAVGGWTGDSGGYPVYLFDLRTGDVLRRKGGLPDTINSLAFSPDGTRLAVGLGGANGIRIFRAGDMAEVATDTDYSATVYGLDFARDGRLAAAAYDGAIRLYNAAGQRLLRVPTDMGAQPFRIRFSPDGSALAVGFNNRLGIEVRNSTTLAVSARPDVAGLDGSNLSRVAWSTDGATLFAGGDPSVNGLRPAFAWDRPGFTRRRVADAGFPSSAIPVRALPDGGLVMLSVVGDLAVARANGTRAAERRTGAMSLTTTVAADNSWRFRVSPDGSVVEWATPDRPQRWLRFEATGLRLAVGEPPRAGLTDWRASDGGLSVAEPDWRDTTSPRVSGRSVQMEDFESARSIAVAHGRVLLGTNWNLRLLDGQARPLWSAPVPTPGVAWRVNQSADGQLLAAALNDGTIRWYRARDGQELLALFLTAEETPRWVAWTPSGYYAASAGGEDLIGWHVNNGPDRAADFFGAARFRDTYHRPDVVTQVLRAGDEATALRAADAARGQRQPVVPVAPATLVRALPPVTTILQPGQGAQVQANTPARLSVRVRSPSGQAVAGLRVLVDGRPAPGATIGSPRPLAPGAPGEALEEREITVDLSAAAGREAVVQVVARTELAEGEAASLRVVVAAPPAVSAGTATLPLPRLNAVLVGVSEYQQARLKLDFAAKDARDLETALQRQRGVLYRDVNVRALHDARATRAALLDALVWLERETTQRDTAVLFLAGHGVTSDDGEFFFLPVDGDEDKPEITGVSGADLVRRLRRMTGRVMVFLDTCYAGALFSQRTRSPASVASIINEMRASYTGVVVYSATTDRERAAERRDLGNGVFTHALLRGLAGEADQHPRDGAIRIQELSYFLAEEVRRVTGGRQKPTFTAPDAVPNLPLFAPRP